MGVEGSERRSADAERQRVYVATVARRDQGKLVAHLEERLPEIEQALLNRVFAVSDPSEVDDHEYVDGLRVAVSAALEHAIGGLGGRTLRPVPEELLSQARRAARDGVPLDTVLRRYCAGYALLSDLILTEAEETGVASSAQGALRDGAAILDRVLTAVAAEYEQEARARLKTAEQRHAEQVRMLLGGQLIDPVEFHYEFDAWHLGLVASGPGAEAAVRELAVALDRNLLRVRRGGETIWAWLGGGRRLATDDVLRKAGSRCPPGICVALGEPARGVEGWRFTHRQAAAAFPVALSRSPGLVRHADVALLASALRDEVLATSLRDLYLAPLESERDGGEALRRTLRAYFAAERNVSATAAALGVSRPTVKSRLRAIEERIGRSPDKYAAEIETALRLRDIQRP